MQTRYKAKRYFREFMPRISARRARASAINWPIARAVLAKSRPVIRQNATSGNLCPGFPRGARASAINWPIARAVLAKSRPVIRQNATSGNYAPDFREASARAILADLAHAVFAKSRQNATSGNLCPGFPRGGSARYYLLLTTYCPTYYLLLFTLYVLPTTYY